MRAEKVQYQTAYAVHITCKLTNNTVANVETLCTMPIFRCPKYLCLFGKVSQKLGIIFRRFTNVNSEYTEKEIAKRMNEAEIEREREKTPCSCCGNREKSHIRQLNSPMNRTKTERAKTYRKCRLNK